VVFVPAEEQLVSSGLPFGENGATKTNRDLGSTERPPYLPWMNFGGPHH